MPRKYDNTLQANELLAKLRLLSLSGQNADGELEWIGSNEAWRMAEVEEKEILQEFNNNF